MCPCCPSPAQWSASQPLAAPEGRQEVLRLIFFLISLFERETFNFYAVSAFDVRNRGSSAALTLTNEAPSDAPSSGNLAPAHLVLSGSICQWDGKKRNKHHLVGGSAIVSFNNSHRTSCGFTNTTALPRLLVGKSVWPRGRTPGLSWRRARHEEAVQLEPRSHRTGWFPVAPAAVDAANLGLGAGQGQTLEVRPGGGTTRNSLDHRGHCFR